MLKEKDGQRTSEHLGSETMTQYFKKGFTDYKVKDSTWKA